MRIFAFPVSFNWLHNSPKEDWMREDAGWAELIGRCAICLCTGLTDLIKGLSRYLGKECWTGRCTGAYLFKSESLTVSFAACQKISYTNRHLLRSCDLPAPSQADHPFQVDRACSCLSHARNDFRVVSSHVCATAVVSVLCTTGHLVYQHGSVRIRDGCR